MKKLSFLFLVLLFAACKDKDNQKDKLPSCIQGKLEETGFLETILTVRTQVIDGEVHYWLNTDAMHVDGVERIVNEACEEVCYLCGECLPPTCTDDYKNDDWETIWER
ncbi:MAG: hypothetical protein AB8F74_12155 [Saprospiraceae bacterium]